MLVVKCKTCSKISRKNYTSIKRAANAGQAKEFETCRAAEHRIEIEKL